MLGIGEPVKNKKEKTRKKIFKKGMSSFLLLGKHYIIAFLGLLIQVTNVFRIILEVAVYYNNKFTPRFLQSCSNSIMLPEVSAQFNSFHTFILPACIFYCSPGFIGTSVFNQYNFKIRGNCRRTCCYVLDKFSKNRFCPV